MPLASPRGIALLVVLLAGSAAADEIVFRVQNGKDGDVEVVRGRILGEDEKGMLRIQVAYGVITKAKDLLVEVRPGIETMLEELTPERPERYLEVAELVIAKQGKIDLGGEYPLDVATRLVFLAIQIEPSLYVTGHRALMGRLDGMGRRTGGLPDPHAALRYAARILRVEPGDPEALAIHALVRTEVDAAEGDFKVRASLMLRAFVAGQTDVFLRLVRTFARPGTPEAHALAASGDQELADWVRLADEAACDACRLAGWQECKRCRGRGTRPVNCDTCGGKGVLRKTCATCNGRGKFLLSETIVGAYRHCPTCLGHREADYDCPDCEGGDHPTPCEVCDGRGQVPCVRCGGDLWRGEVGPPIDAGLAKEAADRYDPEGRIRIVEGAADLPELAPDEDGGLDTRPIVPMGSRVLDPPYDRPVREVVYSAGRWVTVEEKASGR